MIYAGRSFRKRRDWLITRQRLCSVPYYRRAAVARGGFFLHDLTQPCLNLVQINSPRCLYDHFTTLSTYCVQYVEIAILCSIDLQSTICLLIVHYPFNLLCTLYVHFIVCNIYVLVAAAVRSSSRARSLGRCLDGSAARADRARIT